MSDMTAFERQLSREITALMGPVPVVDDAAIFTAITATRSPKWRFHTMFGAARFVAAGAIVALFGGFLLAGVLTQQPSEESAPAVGVSVSPSPEDSALITEVPTAGRFSLHNSIATDDALWVPHLDGRWVSRIDADTGEVTDIVIGDRAALLVPTDDAIWTVDPFEVHRIDRRNFSAGDDIRRSRGQPFLWQTDCFDIDPIIADGSLWIASPGSESHSLVEIDLASQSIRGEYLAGEDWSSDGCGPWMGVIGDAIWVHSQDPDGTGQRLTRFDLGTRRFTDRIDDLPGTNNWWGCCIVDDDAIWLMDERSVSRFDVATLEVTDTLDLGRDLTGGVAAAGAIWVVDGVGGSSGDSNGVVYRIDAVTRQVTDAIDVGRGARPPAFLHGAIWVSNGAGNDRTISRIDVEAREVIETVRLADRYQHAFTPLGSDGVLWVHTEDGYLLRLDAVGASE